MSEHMFGGGPGHLSRRADRIAKRHGAVLVNHTDPGCRCGYGHVRDCPACRRHWFAGPNQGSPFDERRAAAVLRDLRAAGIVAAD